MNRQLILIVLLIAVLGVGGYFWYVRVPVNPEGSASNVAIAEFQQKLGEMRRLTSIDLDTSILQDPFFRSLKLETATDTVLTTPGRANPFVPF